MATTDAATPTRGTSERRIGSIQPPGPGHSRAGPRWPGRRRPMSSTSLHRSTSMPPGPPPTTVVIVHDGVEVASWPLPDAQRHDLAIVDVLARVALAGRRLGFSVRLRDPSDGLLELLELAGLSSGAGCPLAVDVSLP